MSASERPPTAKDLDDALAGARQHIEVVMNTPEWEQTGKRRAIVEDLAHRLANTTSVLQRWLADDNPTD